jgi:hypothetical protein
MCATADLTGCDEILFPEMAAVLCGAWMQPRQAWNVSRPLMVALMAAGATFGVVANLVVPGPPWARSLLSFAFCATALATVGCDMTPMFSAAILPVLLGTTSPAYPLAVTAMVGLVAVGQLVMERLGWRERTAFAPRRLPVARSLAQWGLRLALFAALSAIPYLTQNVYFAVPPLVVAFTAFARKDYTLRLRPWRGWMALSGAAVVGIGCRTLVEEGGMPLPLSAAVLFCGIVWVWNAARAWLPPAGAVALLAMLVPYQGPWLYPLEVAFGAAVWIAAAMLFFPGLKPGDGSDARRP